jgi:hypothetical protein
MIKKYNFEVNKWFISKDLPYIYGKLNLGLFIIN